MSTQEDATEKERESERTADSVKTCNVAMNAALEKAGGYCDTDEAKVENLARLVGVSADFDTEHAASAELGPTLDATLVRQKVVAYALAEMNDGESPGTALNEAWSTVDAEMEAVETPSSTPETPEENEDPVGAPESLDTPPEAVEDESPSDTPSEPAASQPEADFSENEAEASEDGEDDEPGDFEDGGEVVGDADESVGEEDPEAEAEDAEATTVEEDDE